MLSAHKAEPARTRQTDIAPDAVGAGEEALAALVDRIEARLGEGAVRRPVLLESHIPERSETWLANPPPCNGGGGARSATEGAQEALNAPTQPRPLLLLDPPEPIETLADLPDSPPARFTWRRVAHKVARADGPERLSPEWWKPGAAARPERTRDYYRVEDEHGRRFWLFREGLYAREDGAPSWWLHGVFA
jgi:protein ImuB